MKKIILSFLTLTTMFIGCNSKEDTTSSTIKLPYEASYTTDFTNDVSDSALLLVLNSYKYWEAGDIKSLRSTMGDSMIVDGALGFRFRGRTDSLIPVWQALRDSLSSVKIKMAVWLKNHSVKDSMDYINVWYREVDTYKSGRVDSANYEDDNGVKDGKIIWYSSHKQLLK